MIKLKVTDQTKQHQLYENIDYESFWDGTQQGKLDELEQILVRQMLHLPAKRLIDIGCGYGRLLDTYQSACGEIILLDSSSTLLQQAYQRSCGKAICISCDLQHLPFVSGAFDQAMMIRVFHHLPDSSAILQEINRIVAPSGHFLFSYCNKRNLERILRWMIGRNPYNPFTLDTAWVWNVFHMHHPRAVRQLLKSAGFSDQVENGVGVIDKLAGWMGPLGENFPPGLSWAPFLASSMIAPWIFNSSIKSAEGPNHLDDQFSEILQCIRCGSSMKKEKNSFHCPECNLRYPYEDGVIHCLA